MREIASPIHSTRLTGRAIAALSFLGMFGSVATPPAYSYAYGSEPSVEANLLRSFPQVTRSGGALRIATSCETVKFNDDLVDGEGFRQSYFVGAFSGRDGRVDLLVVTHGYESQGFTLINGRTGARVDLPGEPILSPKGTWYLSYSMDLEAGENPNDLLVLRASDFRVEFRWAQPAEPMPSLMEGPGEAHWVGDDEVAFKVMRLKADSSGTIATSHYLDWARGAWREKSRPSTDR